MAIHPSPQEAWTRVLTVVRDQVNDITFRTWFAPLRPTSFHGQELTLEVPNPFFVDWLVEHHAPLLASAAESALEDPIGFNFAVSSEYDDSPLPQVPLGPQSVQDVPAPIRVTQPETALNKRFTFDNFIVGKSNEFCFAACMAVSKSPGRVYNPLFIYGGVGLGKTHIMQAIGNAIRENRPDASIRYLSSERFMNEMIQSIKRGTTFDFKQRYRSADVLLIDDIQFLAGKESTQEEFFHTFNTLYDSHKQIVIISDRPPRELQDLEERLVSRFNWGLVTDMNAPDFETRAAILRRKADQEDLVITDDVIYLIATRITNNVRELEGSLIRLSAFASLTGSAITTDLAEEFLKDLMDDQVEQRVEIPDITKVVAHHFGLSVDALKSKRRTSAIAHARQVAMYLCRKLTGASLMEVGRRFGGRDHTTVLYACDKIDQAQSRDGDLRQVLEDLVRKIKRGAPASL